MKKHYLSFFILTAFLLLILSNTGVAEDQTNQKTDEVKKLNYIKGDLLVKFKNGTPEAQKENIHKKQGSKKIKDFKRLNIHLAKLREDAGMEDTMRGYTADPSVEYAEPNYIVAISTIPGDPLFYSLWGLCNTGQNGGVPGADIDVVPAWDITTGHDDVVVAVIDTGLDYNHPDLLGNIWRNPSEYGGAASIDDDENRYIDDITGINTLKQTGDPMDDHGHGTHIAGTIGAGNNGIGVIGINWNVKIMACKFLNSSGSGVVSGAIECLEYVRTMKERGANIVATNNSWGGFAESKALYDAIDGQRKQGILFIAAAGNSNRNNDKYPFYPADYNLPNVISVAATNQFDSKAWFSNYGERTVHLGAPGSEIISLRAKGSDMYRDGLHFVPQGDPNAEYYSANGTSMAAPHVTGLAALIKADDVTRDWRAVKNLIISGGKNISSMEGITISGKRLSAYGSLRCENSPVLSAIQSPQLIQGGIAGVISALSINCASSVGPVTMTSSSGEEIQLHDDGIPPDLAAGDGIFSTEWTSSGSEYALTFSSPSGTDSVFFPVTIITYSLSAGSRDIPYNQTFEASGGVRPYAWSVATGSLPPGLTLDSSAGLITGTPTTGGTFYFAVRVTDSQGNINLRSFQILVYDAELPITALSNSAGQILPAGTTMVQRGGSQTYRIVPNAGYNILDMLVDGSSVGAVSTYTFTNVTAPHTISASFTQNPAVTITASAGAGGTITPSENVQVVMGMNQSFIIKPSSGCWITDVLVDGISQGPKSGYTFSNVQEDHTISANFGPTIISTAGPGGSISPSGTSYLTSGADKTCTIQPSAGYNIADVLVDGSSVGAVSTYTFTNVTVPHTISATFAQNPTVTITASAGPGGTITPSGTVSVVTGKNQSFIVKPSSGYWITELVVDDVSLGPKSGYTFSNVQEAHTIRASFGPMIKSSAGPGGSISPNGTSYLTSGADNTYSIKPKAGYHISDVLVDGSSVGNVTTYTFTNVTAPHTISASFVQNPAVMIIASAGEGGTITPLGSVSVVMGTNQSFIIKPSSGYRITDVVVDGASLGPKSGYTFSNVQKDHTISVSFGPAIVGSAGNGRNILHCLKTYLTDGPDKTCFIRQKEVVSFANYAFNSATIQRRTSLFLKKDQD